MKVGRENWFPKCLAGEGCGPALQGNRRVRLVSRVTREDRIGRVFNYLLSDKGGCYLVSSVTQEDRIGLLSNRIR